MLEAELFGHVKGSFTGATTDKAGLFEQADGGTLFWMKSVRCPLALQVKLLRVLQESEVRRVAPQLHARLMYGWSLPQPETCRRKLQQAVFVKGLFFRLNVFAVHPAAAGSGR